MDLRYLEGVTTLQSELREAVAGELGDVFRKVMPLAEVERKTILGTMVVASGNKSVAARWLGIDRVTLRKKLTEYGYPTCLQQ